MLKSLVFHRNTGIVSDCRTSDLAGVVCTWRWDTLEPPESGGQNRTTQTYTAIFGVVFVIYLEPRLRYLQKKIQKYKSTSFDITISSI